ncbi:MAG: iron ABC transporter permease [Deltaproteobacteria bacterium]|nr:iron ABC transporter permease [Deltaproteobacteria bacterium]
MSRSRTATFLVGLLAALALTVLLAPLAGMKGYLPWDVLSGSLTSVDEGIFWKVRVPRVLLALVAGAALALSGMTFQSMFRNALATPYTLGVASGGSFGAALTVKLGFTFSIAGLPASSLGAFLGCLLAVTLVYGVTRLKQGFSTATMLLAGVAVGFLFSSLLMFLQYMSDFAETFRIVRWLMGGLDVVGYRHVLELLPLVLVGAAAVFLHLRELNLLVTGDDLAAGRGVDVTAVRRRLFFATSLMVGGVVAACGPIGFVGMMAPHICRLIIGADHRLLAPAAVLLGAVFLAVCDTVARTLIAPAEIPVGVITALLGGPFFLWLLTRGASERA